MEVLLLYIKRFLKNLTVKELCKLVHICQGVSSRFAETRFAEIRVGVRVRVSANRVLANRDWIRTCQGYDKTSRVLFWLRM